MTSTLPNEYNEITVTFEPVDVKDILDAIHIALVNINPEKSLRHSSAHNTLDALAKLIRTTAY